MKAKDYLKSKKIWLGTKVADMNAPENYFNLEDLLENYHQAKLKLLDIPAVMVELPDNHVCRYSKAINQPYPRLCVDCGKLEGN